ncbi:MAG: BamA/TamA family outer membrane protein [candidate division Zixibacteria bacterium]|nr:BamA/TamA family outer membrane protein [candidate division Zixibacteria bacterium]
MKKYALLIFTILFLGTLSPSVYGEKYIRSIGIVRLNVFDNQLEHKSNFLFKLANKFHVVTKERIIRQELLLQSGDVFDKETLEESLRNIRSLVFIGDARSVISRIEGDSVDIKIITEDLWTTAVGASAEGGGGRYNFTIYADEKNIAGLGIGFDANLQFTTDENDGYVFLITDRRLFGSRFMTNIWLCDLSYERGQSIQLNQPFYSLDTKWSFGGLLGKKESEPRIFYYGNEIFKYKYNYKIFNFYLNRAFGKHTRLVPGLQFAYNNHEYSELPGINDAYGLIPQNEIFSGPGINLKISTFRYFTAVYLDEFGTTEDLAEHAFIEVNTIWYDDAFNANYEGAYFRVGAGFFVNPAKRVYIGAKNSYSNYYNGTNRERITNTFNSIIYYKPSCRNLLACRFMTQFGYRQESNYQLVLGGINGLRGYPDRYFEGTKLALTNIEYRIFTPVEIFTVGLGGAVFFDAGYVWDDNERVSLSDMKKDVGIGLRFGLTKSSTARIIRFDLAKALDSNNWYLSFSTENLFGLARFQ